jgi:hypothetical protein
MNARLDITISFLWLLFSSYLILFRGEDEKAELRVSYLLKDYSNDGMNLQTNFMKFPILCKAISNSKIEGRSLTGESLPTNLYYCDNGDGGGVINQIPCQGLPIQV